MEQGLFISIHPEYCTLLSEGKKVHEFRSVKPKRQTDFLWIYESSPSSALTYIARTANPVEFPDQVEVRGDGDARFNKGGTKYRFAFPILELWRLEEPLPFAYLKEHFRFHAPQSYAYLDRYPALVDLVRRESILVKIR